VASMGFQMFADPKKMAILYDQDPEMFQYILGVIRSPMTDSEKENVDQMVAARQKKLDEAAASKKFYTALDKKAKNIDKIIKGSYYRIQKTLNFFSVTHTKENISLGPNLKTKKQAEQFLYMYLWQLSVTHDRPHYDSNIDYCILRKIIPASLKWDAREPIPGITVPDADKLPEDEIEFNDGADAFIQWIAKKGFEYSEYSFGGEVYECSQPGRRLKVTIERGQLNKIAIEKYPVGGYWQICNVYRLSEMQSSKIFKFAKTDIQKLIEDR
jgi:hypothetical protein